MNTGEKKQKERKKDGRRTKLTPELIAKVDQLLRAGNYVTAICDYIGIHQATWYEWIQRGEGDSDRPYQPIYGEFAEIVKRASAVAEIGAVNGILTAGREGNWTAFAWFLERKFHDRWGKREFLKQEITGAGDQPLAMPSLTVEFINPGQVTDDDDDDDADGGS